MTSLPSVLIAQMPFTPIAPMMFPPMVDPSTPWPTSHAVWESRSIQTKQKKEGTKRLSHAPANWLDWSSLRMRSDSSYQPQSGREPFNLRRGQMLQLGFPPQNEFRDKSDAAFYLFAAHPPLLDQNKNVKNLSGSRSRHTQIIQGSSGSA